jgi:hypothetical protein
LEHMRHVFGEGIVILETAVPTPVSRSMPQWSGGAPPHPRPARAALQGICRPCRRGDGNAMSGSLLALASQRVAAACTRFGRAAQRTRAVRRTIPLRTAPSRCCGSRS